VTFVCIAKQPKREYASDEQSGKSARESDDEPGHEVDVHHRLTMNTMQQMMASTTRTLTSVTP
jgi:hypothetical protein